MRPPPTTESFITVAGRQVHHLTAESRNGLLFVLLHGGGTNSALLCWRFLLPALAIHGRVLAPDFPGFGQSEALDSCSLAGLVEFLDHYLEEVGAVRPVLVAHSMAGLVALRFAARAPDRTKALVLVDSLGLGSRVPYRGLIWLARRWRPFHPTLLAATRRFPALMQFGLRYNISSRHARTDPILALDLERELASESAREAWNQFLEDQVDGKRFRGDDPALLSRIEIPVLLVHGEKDRLVPADFARSSVGLLPQASLVELPHCGHWPSREQPDRLGAAIVDFAQEVSASFGT